MRIPIPWHLRQVQRLSNSPKLVLPQLNAQSVLDPTTTRTSHPRSRLLTARCFSARCLHTEATPKIRYVKADNAVRDNDNSRTSKDAATKSRLTAIERLNEYLPGSLRVELPHSRQRVANRRKELPLDPYGLQQLILQARDEQNVEFLFWLVDQGYWKTAVWLMKAILNLSVSIESSLPLKPPSNLAWPQDIFDTVRTTAVDPLFPSHSAARSIDYESFYEASPPNSDAQAQHWLDGHIWEILGLMMIRSAGAGPNGDMDKNRLVALLVLGHIHNLGILPNDIYAAAPKHRPSFVQRPPILNLVSSRVLTALSDAAWRQQQDDAISEAARRGMSMREISKSVPGGRFRLKVRPLGTEVWLELILWCCIESHHASAALGIIKALGSQAESPWFAVRWTSPQPNEKLSTFIDWDRIKLRHGGTTGLVEGYSRENPFVDVPQQTISVEVVLALIEKLITVTVPASLIKGGKPSEFTAHREHQSLRKTLADVEDVMAFLEPHDLPPNYFDYLQSRLEQEGLFDMSSVPQDLHNWCTRMKSIRALAKVENRTILQQGLELPRIYANSLLHIGLQHQAMHGLIQIADVHETLTVFNEIQEKVDEKKVASIADFLQYQSVPGVKGLPQDVPNHELEFTKSHGQVPLYKLAAFLNLLSSTNLVGLGRWLLFGEDVDGAMIPRESWGSPCMTAAVYRFAAASRDPVLLDSASHIRNMTGRQQSIRMVRSLIDANVDLLRLHQVKMLLNSLGRMTAGGFGLSNVVHLAAAIFRLDTTEDATDSLYRKSRIQDQAEGILNEVLEGFYASKRDDFKSFQRSHFRRQVGQVLSVMKYFKTYANSSRSSDIADIHANSFPRSNLPLLPARDFNVLLAAAIDGRGAGFGKRMWEQFCANPGSKYIAKTLAYGEDGYPNDQGAPMSIIDNGTVSQSPLPASDAGDEVFEDPFFPSSSGILQTISNDEIDVPLKERVEDSHDSIEYSPVTVPDLQTLRLIVRALATEYRLRKGLRSRSTRSSRLTWALTMFRQFGITDRGVVEQELQFPLDELDEEVAEQIEPSLETAERRDYLVHNSQQDLTVGAPASEMWIPKAERRRGKHGILRLDLDK